jgi:hypothetical protein
MRVLHLPNNVASQISIIVRAQRAIGVDARGLVIDRNIIQADDGIRSIVPIKPHMTRTRARIQILRRLADIASAARWADVVHWHAGTRVVPRDMDLKIVAALHKARIVEFWGSEIRIPEIAARDNPYLASLLASPDATYRISYLDSRNVQGRFARHGFACLVPGPELPAYVQPDLFPAPYQAEAVLYLQDFLPSYPDPLNRRPVVVHSPSRPAIKGTDAVLAAVEQVKARCDFDFQLVHNVPHAEALDILRGCDIFLDQFVIGSFGTAALEAMAFGKPAICYLKPSVASRLPSDAPYVNANPDDLGQMLESLLTDGLRRQEIGRRSRAYVERHHDAQVVARQLVTIYKGLLSRNHRGREEPTASEREHRKAY